MKLTPIPERLLAERAKRALTQEQAAEQIGIGRDTLTRLEGGKGTAYPSTVSKLCAFYEVSVPYLLGMDDQERDAA